MHSKLFLFQLRVASFLAGFTVMAVELVGSRVLAPYLGTTITIWSALIGMVLAFLSVGYYVGGRLADKYSSARQLSLLYLVAAASIALIPILADTLLPAFSATGLSLPSQSLWAATLFFGLPSLCLGAASPYITRLALNAVKNSGSTIGTFSALSTAGSIAGTLLTGLVLTQYFGTFAILYGLSGLALFVSLLVYPHKSSLLPAGVALVILVAQSISMHDLNHARAAQGFIDTDTAYSRVWVYNTTWKGSEKVKILRIGNEYSSAEYADGRSDLVFDYAKVYHLDSFFQPSPKRILVIGGAAYSYPQELLRRFPEAQVDVVEIDPGVTALAEKYFGLKPDPRLHIIHEDARTFLNRNTVKYDLIFGDAFRSAQIPFQLVSQEAFGHIADSLTDNGVMLMNIIGALQGEKSTIVQAIAETAATRMPSHELFQVDTEAGFSRVQNLILVTSKLQLRSDYSAADAEQKAYLSQRWNGSWPTEIPVLTDSFAPVERYSWSLL